MKKLSFILGLILCVGLASCSSGTYLTPYTPITTPVASTYLPPGATTIANTTAASINPLPSPPAITFAPPVYELRMYGIRGETNKVLFNTSISDRVVCEVNVLYPLSGCYCSIIDGYGNTVGESARRTDVAPRQTSSFFPFYRPGTTNIVNLQKYPWQFAFFPAMTGTYIFEAWGLPTNYSTGEPGEPYLYAKITVYPGS
jgi:hypothetical protein